MRQMKISELDEDVVITSYLLDVVVTLESHNRWGSYVLHHEVCCGILVAVVVVIAGGSWCSSYGAATAHRAW